MRRRKCQDKNSKNKIDNDLPIETNGSERGRERKKKRKTKDSLREGRIIYIRTACVVSISLMDSFVSHQSTDPLT